MSQRSDLKGFGNIKPKTPKIKIPTTKPPASLKPVEVPTKQKVSLTLGNYLRLAWDGVKGFFVSSTNTIVDKVLSKAPWYFWLGLLIIIGIGLYL